MHRGTTTQAHAKEPRFLDAHVVAQIDYRDSGTLQHVEAVLGDRLRMWIVFGSRLSFLSTRHMHAAAVRLLADDQEKWRYPVLLYGEPQPRPDRIARRWHDLPSGKRYWDMLCALGNEAPQLIRGALRQYEMLRVAREVPRVVAARWCTREIVVRPGEIATTYEVQMVLQQDEPGHDEVQPVLVVVRDAEHVGVLPCWVRSAPDPSRKGWPWCLFTSTFDSGVVPRWSDKDDARRP